MLFVATDRWGRRIACTKLQWKVHVCANRPFMEEWGEYARQTVEDPDAVVLDARYPNRESYYRAAILPGKYQRFYLKVVVQLEGQNGHVVTAFVTDGYKTEESIKWIAHRSS